MLYETLLHGKMFLVMIYFGIWAGILLTAKKLAMRPFCKSKVAVVLTDILFVTICSALFLIAKIKFCYGEFRLFELIAFLLGIFAQQFSLNNLVEKILKLLYTTFVRIFCKLKKTKLFGKILK